MAYNCIINSQNLKKPKNALIGMTDTGKCLCIGVGENVYWILHKLSLSFQLHLS